MMLTIPNFNLRAILVAILLVAIPLPVYSQSSPYQEAPTLAEQVKAGKLPPVEKRLPANPMVVQPEEKTGIYGGTWHMVMLKQDRNFMFRTLGYEGLVRWDSQWTRVIPNLAQSIDVNDAVTEYTFHLRQGLRWSDGEPFNADDIMFWYDAVFMNKELTPAPAPYLVINGKPVVVEKKDNYTVVFRFAAPYGIFLQRLASPPAMTITNYARHYYTQFHKDYNPNIADMIAKEGVKTWTEVFLKKAPPFTTFNLYWQAPTLNPWMLTSDFYGDANVLKATRNPYYWKIDTDFNQLPYIDNVEFAVVKDSAAMTDTAVKGLVDMQNRQLGIAITDPGNMKQGGYHLFNTVASDSNAVVISLNMNHTDPVKRTIFQNRDFRIGLSYAINRSKISKAEPYQVAPVPESPLYNEQLAKQYTGYDVSKANAYLDKAGYTKRDTDGFRLGPDGNRIAFKIVRPDSLAPAAAALMQVQGDWKAVGIEITVQDMPRPDAEATYARNQFDATVWSGDGGFDVILEPRYYFPYSNSSLYALLWAKWYYSPQDPTAEEPPAVIKQQMQLYNQIQATADVDKQIALMKQILDIAADQFYVIGLYHPATGYGVIRNNFRNVPSTMPDSGNFPNPAPTNPCQYYIDPQT